MKSKICTKRGIGSILIIVGIVCVLAALALLLWNIREAKRAEDSVSYILPQLMEQIEESPPTDGSQQQAQQEEIGAEEASEEQQNVEQAQDAPGGGMESREVSGENYIGVLSLPTLDLELPVMADWSYPRLKIAPCRYTGSVETGDMVIAAHNYMKHFGTLRSLEKGDRVYFTDMENRIYTYEVAEVEILQPTAIEEMTAGEYDLTLFTCTYGGKSRVTVRCMSVVEETEVFE
jgi:sortase A